MSSPSRTKPLRGPLGATIAFVIVAGTMLAGCSDIYYDRRDTVALGADEHIASNRVAQMIDPWPRNVERREIAFNGQKMQNAVERYRTGRAFSPVNVTTSSAAYQEAQKSAASTMNEVTPFSTPAAPVK